MCVTGMRMYIPARCLGRIIAGASTIGYVPGFARQHDKERHLITKSVAVEVAFEGGLGGHLLFQGLVNGFIKLRHKAMGHMSALKGETSIPFRVLRQPPRCYSYLGAAIAEASARRQFLRATCACGVCEVGRNSLNGVVSKRVCWEPQHGAEAREATSAMTLVARSPGILSSATISWRASLRVSPTADCLYSCRAAMDDGCSSQRQSYGLQPTKGLLPRTWHHRSL